MTRTRVASQVEQFTELASVSRIHMVMQLRCNFYLSQSGAESDNYRALLPAPRPTTSLDQADSSSQMDECVDGYERKSTFVLMIYFSVVYEETFIQPAVLFTTLPFIPVVLY